MNYSVHYDEIKYMDQTDPLNLYVTLSLSSIESSNNFTENHLTDIVNELKKDEYSGFIIKCDSLYSDDRTSICDIARTVKALFGNDRSIFVCTNDSVESIVSYNDSVLNELMDYVDCLFEKCNTPDKAMLVIEHTKNQCIFHRPANFCD